MNNSRAEKLSKVVSAKVTLKEYNLCKEIAAKLYESGEIGRNSVSELVRVLVESFLCECRNKQQNLNGSYNNNNNSIDIQNNTENNNKMQSVTEQQLIPMPLSLIHSQEYRYNQRYGQQEKEKKQEDNQNQQLYDIMSRMPEIPTLPPNTKQASSN
jgi:predicted HTH domain antitoxin